MVEALIQTDNPHVAFDADAILGKVRRYADYALEDKGDGFKFGLWSALMLEHLARCVLAAVHPSLLIESEKGDFTNLALSLGLEPTGKKAQPKSLPISQIAQRLEALFENVTGEDRSFIVTHCGRRNAELHSGEEPFDEIDVGKWEPELHRTVKRLLTCIGKELEDVYGSD
jgi:hypothetical protein